MANNIHVAAAYNKGMMDGAVNIKTDSNAGKLCIFSGAQPTDGDTAVGAQVCLATLVMNATAFSAASGTASTNQTMTAGAITSETAASAGTAAWFRLYKSDHTSNTGGSGDTGTKIMDGSVGTASCDINLNTTTIAGSATVAITSLTITLNK